MFPILSVEKTKAQKNLVSSETYKLLMKTGQVI